MSADSIREAEAEVAACRRAAAITQTLADEIAAEQRVCQVLRSRLRDEQADVDALENVTVRSVFARLRGATDEQLERERAEVAAVEVELATHQQAVRELMPEFERSRDLSTGLTGAEARLATALEQRARQLADDPTTAARLAEVDGRLAVERAALDRIREAHGAAHAAAGALELAIESMSSAHGMSVFDTMSDDDGLVGLMKHRELDGSVERFANVHAMLLRLRPLLSGLTGDVHRPNLRLPSVGLATVDVWFDNVFADVMTHQRIASSLRELEISKQRVDELIDELASYEMVSSGRVDAVDAERAALLRR